MSLKLYANLHNHSTHSDGVYTPYDLVMTAKNEGYHAIALTDHDTVTGCREVKEICARPEVNMEYIFGAEFTSPAEFAHQGFHIVGFDFDPEYPQMKKYLADMSLREAEQTRILFERGIASGYLHDITWQEVLDYNAGITWLCNEHVFRAMKHKELASDLDYPAFFNNVYGVHRGEVPPCCNFLPLRAMISLIHSAGGIALVAHPAGQLRFIDNLIDSGIDGIEVWHQMLDRNTRDEALALAAERNLYVSGGADHEGLCGGQYARYANPEQTPFYAEPCSLGTTEKLFREILERRHDSDRKEYLLSLIGK